jgi:hypothetical protein
VRPESRVSVNRDEVLGFNLLTICAALVAGLLLGRGGKPDTGRVGPQADLEPPSSDHTVGTIVVKKPGVLLTEEHHCTGFSQLEIGTSGVAVRQGNSSGKQG